MENYLEFLSDLENLIACESVLSDASKNAPFGIEVKKALDTFLNIASRMGFETKNYDNYIGEVIYGAGEEIGIIGHVDVVPVGNGWETNPFKLTEKDGFLYGRGIGDDKAPLLSCLYALYELKKECDKEGRAPNRKFRLIVGCDEESGWRDVDYLNKVSYFPEYGFSPDGNFPVVYAEKGITVVTFKIPHLKNFNNITGGTVVNAVCGYASAYQTSIIDKTLAEKYNIKVNGDGKIESFGVSCHGSMPERGINALKGLFEYFIACGEDVKNVYDCLFQDKYGVFNLKNEQGGVTLSPDLICEKDDGVYITCDCRIPAPLSQKDVFPYFEKFGIEYSASEKHPSFMIDKNEPFVQTLLSAYNVVTGENAKAEIESGSTFARVFKKGCAFGAEFPNRPSTIHQPNENMAIEDLKLMHKIYKTAIFNLAK